MHPALWPDTLCGIADFCGVANAAMVVVDNSLGYSSVLTPRADPAVVAAYEKQWWQHDPTSAATAALPVGQISSLTDTGRETYFASAFHNEFWRKSGLGAERLACNLANGPHAFSSVVLQASASRDEIGEETAIGSRLVIPHLVRAVSIMRKLRRLEIESAKTCHGQGEDHAGMIVVDAEGRILFTDDQAQRLLTTGGVIHSVRGFLQLAARAGQRQYLATLHSCARMEGSPVSSFSVPMQHEGREGAMVVDVMPYRANAGSLHGTPAAAIVLLRDPGRGKRRKIESFRARFGLTQAEATLALEMLAGDGREAAAARCGISVNTARTHLSRIFEKTGVRRQAELIRVLMDSPRQDN